MKQIFSMLLCVLLLAGCGQSEKSLSYFPYNENLRLDATKQDIIAAEKLVADDDIGFSYHKPETISIQNIRYQNAFYFDPSSEAENGYINMLSAKREVDYEKEYAELVKHFSKIYGEAKNTDTETAKNSSWTFNIDTEIEYNIGATTFWDEKSQKYCLSIIICKISEEVPVLSAPENQGLTKQEYLEQYLAGVTFAYTEEIMYQSLPTDDTGIYRVLLIPTEDAIENSGITYPYIALEVDYDPKTEIVEYAEVSIPKIRHSTGDGEEDFLLITPGDFYRYVKNMIRIFSPEANEEEMDKFVISGEDLEKEMNGDMETKKLGEFILLRVHSLEMCTIGIRLQPTQD